MLVRQAIALIVNIPDDTMAIEDEITDGGSATAVGAATGREYSAHVATCAQTVGFSATHNPGMHHGCGHWRGDTWHPPTRRREQRLTATTLAVQRLLRL